MTTIEWTDETWNPTSGCTKVSAGCRNCYAETIANRFWGDRPFSNVQFHPERLETPLRWKKPRMVFVNSMSDLFHDAVTDEQLDQVFAVMALTPQHTYQCLTKRPERMLAYFQGNALRRITTFLCDIAHEQRANSTFQRAFRDRFPRIDLANCQATRQGNQARGRLLYWSENQSLQASESGISAPSRLSVSGSNDRGSESGNGSASPSVALFQRRNPERHDDQSQKWDKERQSTRELGIGNAVGAAPSCARGSQCESESPCGEQTSQNKIDRIRRDSDSSFKKQGSDGQRHCSTVSNEIKSSVSNLQLQDLEAHLSFPLPNVWLGVSVENQKAADDRIPLLLQTPAAVRFLSCEPLLEHLEIEEYLRGIDWVICGGESGGKARYFDLEWARSLRDQCKDAGVAFFLKQLGSNHGPQAGMDFKCGSRKWGDIEAFPPDLQIREFPKVQEVAVCNVA